jgi:hypothetical protein
MVVYRQYSVRTAPCFVNSQSAIAWVVEPRVEIRLLHGLYARLYSDSMNPLQFSSEMPSLRHLNQQEFFNSAIYFPCARAWLVTTDRETL